MNSFDDHLLTRAQADDPLAVRTLAAIAAHTLAPLVTRQPELAWLLTVAQRLANGETVPNPLALPVEGPKDAEAHEAKKTAMRGYLETKSKPPHGLPSGASAASKEKVSR